MVGFRDFSIGERGQGRLKNSSAFSQDEISPGRPHENSLRKWLKPQ
jgi:hypothetical protein